MSNVLVPLPLSPRSNYGDHARYTVAPDACCKPATCEVHGPGYASRDRVSRVERIIRDGGTLSHAAAVSNLSPYVVGLIAHRVRLGLLSEAVQRKNRIPTRLASFVEMLHAIRPLPVDLLRELGSEVVS